MTEAEETQLEEVVKRQLTKDFVGNRLDCAVYAVMNGIKNTYPDIHVDNTGVCVPPDEEPLTEEELEEFVFDVAAHEGY